MPTAPLQVSHLSGLQPPLSQTCQRYQDQQPTDADAADQPNHWLPAHPSHHHIPLGSVSHVANIVSLMSNIVSLVSHCVSLMSHFAFHVSDVSHIITWCHTLQTVSATRFHVAPDSHSNLSRLCHICVTFVSHLCHICVTFVSHLCHTCVTFVSHLCNICVTLVSH